MLMYCLSEFQARSRHLKNIEWVRSEVRTVTILSRVFHGQIVESWLCPGQPPAIWEEWSKLERTNDLYTIRTG